MASDDSHRFSSNLKVPPLKIVLNSNQNNTVVNMASASDDDRSSKSSSKDSNTSESFEIKDTPARRPGASHDGPSQDVSTKHMKKGIKSSFDRVEADNTHNKSSSSPDDVPSEQISGSSMSSSSSSASDRSNATSPSSESESLVSNSTIISDHQTTKIKLETKEDGAAAGKKDSQQQQQQTSHSQESQRHSRNGVKNSNTGDKVHNTSTSQPRNKSLDTGADQQMNEQPAIANNKDQTLNANQRITRSSQRAAQQNKSEHTGDSHLNDEQNPVEAVDKSLESVRKAKRRKGEPQESEQDSNVANCQQPLPMANIHPADYQLPPQNSFELYRDIRKRPYKKLSSLSHIQPKVPQGFKDYLLNSGPYLLDGNKLGSGLTGLKAGDSNRVNSTGRHSNFHTAKPITSLHPKSRAHQHYIQRHTAYAVPELQSAPSSLARSSPLHELFLEHEKSRYQMKMQHLKERERAVLSVEQEILRAHNKAAIANVKQRLHLSACTYFYYQERYHYSNEKPRAAGKKSQQSDSTENPNDSSDKANGVEATDVDMPQRLDDSEDVEMKLAKSADSTNKNAGQTNTVTDHHEKGNNDDVKKDSNNSSETPVASASVEQRSDNTNCKTGKNGGKNSVIDNCDDKESRNKQPAADNQAKNYDLDADISISEYHNEKDDPTRDMSDDELKNYNKEIFIKQLQEIDNKWDKIKTDMCVRHRHEADSLYAVQILEWEWKAKEIGACDVRVSLKVEPEFVPRVEVLAIDY